MINGNKKGKVGERELAAFLREYGYEARRGQQYAGGGTSPDVVSDLPDIHIEVKRVEAGNLYKWLEQAKRDAAGTGKTPVVFHRKNREDWVVVLDAHDFLTNYVGGNFEQIPEPSPSVCARHSGPTGRTS